MWKRSICFIAAAGALAASAPGAEAFWAARGPRGAVAVGAPLAGAFVRPPAIAGHYYAGGCLRCAPYYAPGAVAAGVALGAAAAAAERPAYVPPPPMVVAAPPAVAPPPAAAAPPQPAASVVASAPAAAPAAAPPSQPACVARLSPEARAIYNAARAATTPSSDLKDTVTAQTRALVMSGKVQMSSARASATSAGECLAQAQ